MKDSFLGISQLDQNQYKRFLVQQITTTFSMERTEINVSDLAGMDLEVGTPTYTAKNQYGPISVTGKHAFFRIDDHRIYGGERPSIRQPMPDQYPFIQTVRLQVSGDVLNGFKALDDLMLSSKDTLESYSQTSDLSYRPVVNSYTKKDGTDGHSIEINLDVHAQRMEYRTIFFDGDDKQRKFKDYQDLVSSITSRSTISIKFTAEYQIRTERKEYNVILRAKFVQMKDDPNSSEDHYELTSDVAALQSTEMTLEDMHAHFTLVRGEDAMMTKQKMARLLYKDIPGKRIRLSDMKLHKGSYDTVYVGLPPENYADESTTVKNTKITFIAEDENLEFLTKLDQYFSEMTDKLRELWDIAPRIKLNYVPIVKTDNEAPLFKLELFEEGPNKTKFIMNDTVMDWNSINDIRPFIRLGTVFKNINMVVSKVWHAKADKQYSVKLKLKSCVIVPPQSDASKEEYLNFGKFS